MQYQATFEKYNASHQAIEITPDPYGDGVEAVILDISEQGGTFVIGDPGIAEVLGTDGILKNDAWYLAQLAQHDGKLFFAVDVRMGNDGKLSCCFRDPSKFFNGLPKEGALGTNTFLIVDPQKAKEINEFSNTEELLSHFNAEAERLQAALNGDVYVLKGPSPDGEGNIAFGPYYGLEDAEEAARQLFPEYCYGEEDFELKYCLKSA